MKRVVRISRQGKVRPVRRRALAAVPAVNDQDSMIGLIQALIPLGLQAVHKTLEDEVSTLAGARYSRTGGQPMSGASPIEPLKLVEPLLLYRRSSGHAVVRTPRCSIQLRYSQCLHDIA